jgi:uncharacterized membrane protein YkvA (DUF1232 family)
MSSVTSFRLIRSRDSVADMDRAAAMTLMNNLRRRARALKTETLALYLAVRDPRVPWYAKLLAAAVVAYALSPIDLIPDFIPILGYLDDLIIVPLGIAAVLRMIPLEVMEDCRERARIELAGARPVSRVAAAVIILIWIVGAALITWLIYRALIGG